jgi:protein-disulfide isomerase
VIAAEVEGQPITLAEVDARAQARLSRLRQEEYEIRRDALSELISERLLEAEARKRGIAVDELRRREIAERAEAPPAGLAASIYSRNTERFAGVSREKALGRIHDLLVERSQSERRAAFDRELREGKTIEVRLEPPRVAVDIPEGAPSTGPENAKVTIVEFTDYQCPYCHRAQATIEQVLARYSDKVRFVHLDFPLESHAGAVPAARAARCAGEQGRFWDYHKSLMTHPGSLDEKDLEARAAEMKLDASKFAACVGSDAHDDAIRRDLERGEALGVSGTPAYFINGRMISGARPLDTFTDAIDAELGG